MSNHTDNEIWFERWLWSYMPCHWKGWAIVILHIVATLAVAGLLTLAADHFQREWISDLAIIPLLAALFSLNRISKRHSRPIEG